MSRFFAHLALLILTVPAFAHAQAKSTAEEFLNPLKSGSIMELLNALLAGVIRLGAIALVLALVWVGFLFVAAQGNDEKLKQARSVFMWTVVGGLILLGAELIRDVVVATVQSIL